MNLTFNESVKVWFNFELWIFSAVFVWLVPKIGIMGLSVVINLDFMASISLINLVFGALMDRSYISFCIGAPDLLLVRTIGTICWPYF